MPEGIQVLGLDSLGISDDIPETEGTIEGNSLMKTQYVFNKCKTACFGDDTGLEVEALNNEPGAYSARYAGPENDSGANMDKLLRSLGNNKNRSARFKTVITYINLNGEAKQFTGIVRGNITVAKIGNGGFGYDPVFKPEGHESTFAEMSIEEKNMISHRGRAFQLFMDYLNARPI